MHQLGFCESAFCDMTYLSVILFSLLERERILTNECQQL
jgi:hypothetical protein